ncbi:asparaginase [Falsiroseomonas sp. CW058]|uniref:asparaginase n=1 Tax=Falsiroseomonas sp. CW058 TaxID=3388664 RepID=UPI003D3125DF
MTKPKVAVIGTGGTIASQGVGPLDVADYASSGLPLLDAEGLVAGVPALKLVADVVPVLFSAIPSTAVGWSDWRALVAKVAEVKAAHPDLAGIVVTHGTATLEETAYLLSLTLPDDGVPVVLTGAQRPFTGLSTDGHMNLVAAVRAAGAPASRGRGVLVVLNDEIHAAREVTKTSTGRLQTFRSPDLGVLGHVDADGVTYWRRPERYPPGRLFDIRGIEAPPRVDVAYSVAGGDGVATRAFLAAGAQGIVAAGFAPGFTSPAEREALAEAAAGGCVVVMSSRAGSGRTFPARRYQAQGIVNADNLNPQKARVLLMLALTVTRDRAEIAGLFATN